MTTRTFKPTVDGVTFDAERQSAIDAKAEDILMERAT